MFHQREMVRIGEPDAVAEWRDTWRDRALELLRGLELDASTFGIRLADGGVAHTACLGFGEERIVLALLRAHGLDTDDWPADVRERLWGDAA